MNAINKTSLSSRKSLFYANSPVDFAIIQIRKHSFIMMGQNKSLVTYKHHSIFIGWKQKQRLYISVQRCSTITWQRNLCRLVHSEQSLKSDCKITSMLSHPIVCSFTKNNLWKRARFFSCTLWTNLLIKFENQICQTQ